MVPAAAWNRYARAMPHLVVAILIGAGVLALPPSARELGLFVARQRGKRREGEDRTHIGAVQAAMLGLLGLLLAFAFSGATARFMERQDILLRESLALGTAYSRADLMEPAQRNEVQSALRDYVDVRIRIALELNEEASRSLEASRASLEHRIWGLAVGAARDTPALAQSILPPFNDAFDSFAARNAAMDRHLPALVLALLLASAAASMYSVGYAEGWTRKGRHTGSIMFGLLVSIAVWVTIDLDHARYGLIRISGKPLADLRATMAPDRPSPGAE